MHDSISAATAFPFTSIPVTEVELTTVGAAAGFDIPLVEVAGAAGTDGASLADITTSCMPESVYDELLEARRAAQRVANRVAFEAARSALASTVKEFGHSWVPTTRHVDHSRYWSEGGYDGGGFVLSFDSWHAFDSEKFGLVLAGFLADAGYSILASMHDAHGEMVASAYDTEAGALVPAADSYGPPVRLRARC